MVSIAGRVVRVNLRDLKYLVAVAETRHFGRAAERCFVSQPTLSGQIRKLEQELGVALFERTNRRVTITPIGERILEHAHRLIEQAEAIEELARRERDPVSGPLRVGAIPTVSPYLMPLLLLPLRKAYPRLRLILSEEITETLLQRLRAHEIDAAIIATDVDDASLVSQPLFREPFWFAMPRDHPLYNKDSIEETDLEQVDLLVLADGHCLARQVMDVCRIADRQQQGEYADLRAASLVTLLQLVGAGFGCTLVPALAVGGTWMTDGGVVARPLDWPDAHRTVRLVYRESFPRRATIDAFVAVLRRHLPNTVQRLGTDAV